MDPADIRAVLCVSHASGVAVAVADTSRLLSAIAASRAMQRFAHLFSATVIDCIALFPEIAASAGHTNSSIQSAVLGSAAAGIDFEPVIAGLFCLFDRCRSSKQKSLMFATIGVSTDPAATPAKLLMSDVHDIYQREYKFAGLV
jgi:hypothetical protein